MPHKDDPLIDRLLTSLAKQTERSFEVIVVDSSDDDTVLKRLDEWKSTLDLKVIRAKCGRGTARNIGAKASEGDVLVFVDADVVLPANFNEELTKLFHSDSELVAAGFPIYPAEPGRIPETVYAFLRVLDEASYRYGKPRIPTTCAAYRRFIFQSRFFLDIIGEDVLFSADITKYGKAVFAKHIRAYEEPRRWSRISEIPRSLWHYIPAFATNILILTGLHKSMLPRQEFSASE